MKKLAYFFSIKTTALSVIAAVLFFTACKEKDCCAPPPIDEGDLTDIPYDPKPYTIVKPGHFPEVPVPPTNPMTVEGVQLGRRLFYDPILSADSTQSCSSCHLPKGSFTDNMATSKGIDGIFGRRSSMALVNIAYAETTGDDDPALPPRDFFWDGRARSLEDQATRPVEDPIEMHNTWANVISKLKKHPDYPARFRKAFGISKKDEITKELAAKAIAQFERIFISSGKSKYDQFLQGLTDLDDDEADGKIMFFDEAATFGLNLPDGQCFHCHGGFTLTGNQYFNNGLDEATTLEDFKDKGRGEVTKNPNDNGKFRATTLRNIALTAPYMHDGRFKTLEEVLDHYGTHGKPSPNKDRFIDQIGFLIPGSNPVRYDTLSIENRKKIVKFLHTLTDTDFVNNPDIQSPF